MSEDKKDIVLRLPEPIFAVIKKYKQATGVSYTNFIYNAIIWYLIKQGLLSLDLLKVSKNVKKSE